MDRRTTVAEAAIRVLSDAGSRGLTHRAVDAEAGLPPGASSNVFRTRRSLVDAVIDHLLEQDKNRLVALAAAGWATPGQLASAFIVETLRDAREQVVARAALLTDPDADRLRDARNDFVGFGAALGSVTGAAPQAIRMIVAVMDGVLLDGALFGTEPDARLVSLVVDALLLSDAPPEAD